MVDNNQKKKINVEPLDEMLKIVVLYMFSWEKWALIMMVMMAECKD